MLETTNSRFGYKCGNIELCEFSRDKKIFWFGDLHTSYVTECKISENIMTIITRNSEYTFELLDGTKFEEFKRSTDEISKLEDICQQIRVL